LYTARRRDYDEIVTTPATPQLDYAEPLPLHRRRWVHRWIIRAAVLTAAFAAYRMAPVFWIYLQPR
jgi:hypothetical protein